MLSVALLWHGGAVQRCSISTEHQGILWHHHDMFSVRHVAAQQTVQYCGSTCLTGFLWRRRQKRGVVDQSQDDGHHRQRMHATPYAFQLGLHRGVLYTAAMPLTELVNRRVCMPGVLATGCQSWEIPWILLGCHVCCRHRS